MLDDDGVARRSYTKEKTMTTNKTKIEQIQEVRKLITTLDMALSDYENEIASDLDEHVVVRDLEEAATAIAKALLILGENITAEKYGVL
jgi:hypothetical protein